MVDRVGGARAGQAEAPALAVVAEDSEDLAMVLAESLEGMGYDVRIARDGAAALDVLRIEDPGLLLVDLGLPRHDGTEVVQIARRSRGATLPIIVMTGQGDADVHQRARAAGCDVILMKPFSVAQLADAVARARAHVS